MRVRIGWLISVIAVVSLQTTAGWAQTAGSGSSGSSGSEPGSPGGGVVSPEQPGQAITMTSFELVSDGSVVNAAPSGDQVQMRVTLTNQGDKAADNVSMGLTSGSDGVSITRASASFGDLSPGESATGNYAFVASSQNCSETAGFVGQIASSLGDDVTKFVVEVLCPGPRLYVESVSYKGGNGDDIPDPGEKLQVFVTLANSGRDAATDVRGKLTISAYPKVTVVDGSAVWNDIPAGSSGVSTSPFVIQIAADAERQKGCDSMPVVRVTDSPASEPKSGDSPVSSDQSGSGTSTVATTPPDSTTASEPASQPEPRVTSTTAEPPGGTPEPGPEVSTSPTPQEDLAVAFEANLEITASGTTSTTGFGTQIMCALMGERGGPVAGAPAADKNTGARGSGRGGAIGAAAGLTVVVGGLLASLIRRRRARAA